MNKKITVSALEYATGKIKEFIFSLPSEYYVWLETTARNIYCVRRVIGIEN